MSLDQTKPKKILSLQATKWIGSPFSLILHTVVFAGVFLLGLFGYDWNSLLLILTTAVSLEAIYLSILIQMTVNQHTESLQEVEEDLDEIQEDVGEIQEDIGEIQEDVDEIRVEEVIPVSQSGGPVTLEGIKQNLEKLLLDIERLKQNKDIQ